MAQRVKLGRGPWEYDAPMYHDFEQSSPSYENCSVDKWFDTSATKGLRSPVSGVNKENDGTVEEVTSKSSKPATMARKALGNVTNTIQMTDPVIGKAKTVTKASAAVHVPRIETVQTEPPKPGPIRRERARVIEKDATNSRDEVEKVCRPVTRSQRKQSTLTVPKSPMLLSRLRSDMHRKVVKSSEELEMEEIEKKRVEIMSRKGKKKPSEKRKGSDMDATRTKRIRTTRKSLQHDTSLQHVAGSFNVGKPLNNSTKCSRNKTSRPRLTMPKSPNFATTRRARPPRFKSSEELELELISKVKFKAKPLNKRMMSTQSAPKLAPKQKKAVTVPEPFSFATDKRANQSSSNRQEASSFSKPFIFGAGPVTRSKSKNIVTIGARKNESNLSVSQDKNPVSVPRSKSEELPKLDLIASTKESIPRARPATRGSLLKGGAMRVVRKDDEVAESSVEQQIVVNSSVEKDATSIATTGDNEVSTFNNPLFRP